MVYKSRFPDKEYPKDKSVYEFLFQNDRNLPKDTLIYIDTERPEKCYTYEQVHTQILKAAAGFKRVFNIQKGDVVGICSLNHVDYPIILHGAVCAGGTAASISPNPAAIIAGDLSMIQPKILIAHKDTLDHVLAAAKLHGLPESHILVFDCSVGSIRSVNETILSGNELAVPYAYTPEELAHDPAYLCFTSGTTGKKKAVIITQSCLVVYMHFKSDWPNTKANALAFKEYHHTSSLVSNMLFYIRLGITSYVMAKYDVRSVCSYVEKFKIHMISIHPYIITALAKDKLADQYDLSSLKVVYSTGSTVFNSVTRGIMKRLGIKIVNTFAMTEGLCLFEEILEPEDDGFGYLSSNVTARIIDCDGNDVPAGQVGELLVKSPTVTQGYYRDPESTATSFDAEGYYHTGDLVRCDENGVFHYVDRMKDLIAYTNRRVYPCIIEGILMAHPKVSECVAIGVYSAELMTELPRAYVKLISGEKHTEEIQQELLEYANSRLSDFQYLRGGVVLVHNFPRTTTGKIERRKLRQIANDEGLS